MIKLPVTISRVHRRTSLEELVAFNEFGFRPEWTVPDHRLDVPMLINVLDGPSSVLLTRCTRFPTAPVSCRAPPLLHRRFTKATIPSTTPFMAVAPHWLEARFWGESVRVRHHPSPSILSASPRSPDLAMVPSGAYLS